MQRGAHEMLVCGEIWEKNSGDQGPTPISKMFPRLVQYTFRISNLNSVINVSVIKVSQRFRDQHFRDQSFPTFPLSKFPNVSVIKAEPLTSAFYP